MQQNDAGLSSEIIDDSQISYQVSSKQLNDDGKTKVE
jgi:hypothetical protein